ncbi:hypothetical protein R1flu_029134 [Riccia fluitans]|uniref:cAMP-dependent protein kinase regulatory subunit n=1 Tax=Riccia fluitans TaxID=41844 RepID=A0ABD1XRI9_9MARC
MNGGRDLALSAADVKLKAKAKSISMPRSNLALKQRERSKTLSFRRTGVSAEVFTGKEKFEKKVVEKDEDTKMRIRAVLQKSCLFQHVDQEQLETIVEAVEEVHFNEGDVIINQGEPGDNFYCIEMGAAEAWITKPGSKRPEKVKQYSSGETFGELALLHNAPRAATVKASTDCVLWAVDRSTFRAIIMTTTRHKREMYESFLKEVPLLKSLNNYERATIADVLEPEYFGAQHNIVVEGGKGDKFYLIEEGEAEARTQGKVVMHYKRGDYFGELALLNDAPRAATVTTLTKCKVASVNRDQFKAKFRFTAPDGLQSRIVVQRLLGKLEDIMQRKKENYEKMNAESAVSPASAPFSPAAAEESPPSPTNKTLHA